MSNHINFYRCHKGFTVFLMKRFPNLRLYNYIIYIVRNKYNLR